MTYSNDEKIDYLAGSAIAMIEKRKEMGQIPLLMAFATPPKFHTIELVTPQGLDAETTIKHVVEAIIFHLGEQG